MYAGTLGTLYSNALAGGFVGGIAGSLTGWGISEEDAKHYEEEMKAGKFLVTVYDEARVHDVWLILSRHGAHTLGKV